MKAPLFFFLTASAMAYTVSIEGKPSLENTLMPSVEWSGGSIQLTVKVKVLGDDGSPAKGVQVRISAQSGASLARLRGFGLTDSDGLAILITAFDVPVVTLAKVSLSACAEPDGDCSVTRVYDLRQRWDIEAENTYSENAGNQGFSSTSAPGGSETILSTGTQYEVLGRAVLNLFSGGSLSHMSTWSAYAEGGAYFLHSTAFGAGVAYFGNGLGIYVLKTVTTTGLHPSANAGLQGEAWGRLFGSASFSPPLSGNPGVLHAQGAWAQPLGRRIELIGGYATDVPEFGGNQNQYGSARGPLFGLAIARARGAAMSITLLGSWVSTGRNQFQDSNGGLWTIPAAQSPSVQMSFDYHRGGPAFVSFYIAGQQLTTNSRTFNFGTTVTLRNFLRRTTK